MGEAVLVTLATPVFSPLARQANVEGDVVVAVTVHPDGTADATVVSGNPLLKRSALDSAMQSKFECHHCTASVSYSLLYKFAFLTVEVISRVFEIIPVLFASIFLKAVVPSGGLSAVAVFVDDAAKRGQSAARAAEGSLFVLVADLVTTLPIIAYGLYYLDSQRALQLYEVAAAAFFVLFAAVLAGMLLLGRLQPDRLRAVLEQAQRIVNNVAARFKRPPILAANWAETNARECIGAACDIAAHPLPLGRTLITAFVVHLINIACLYIVALAYRQPLPVGALVAAFSMDIVFSVITFIPHGIGVSEGVMALVFISLAVSSVNALVITITFRGLNVWLPIAIGFFFVHRIGSFGGGRQP